MNIPQVNVNVTDVEREKTKRALQLMDYDYDSGERALAIESCHCGVENGNECSGEHDYVELSNGSLTLDQCVGKLIEEGYEWLEASDDINGPTIEQGWHSGEKSFTVDNPHSLSENFDVLIKVLEEKKNEESQKNK